MSTEVLDAAVRDGRAEAESRMTSRVTVWRTVADTAQDEDTGLEEPVREALAEQVPFRLKGGRSRTITIGGVEFEEATAEGHLPADLDALLGDDSKGLWDGDVFEVTAGEWVGTSWRVVEAVKGDQRTARRVPIVEV